MDRIKQALLNAYQEHKDVIGFFSILFGILILLWLIFGCKEVKAAPFDNAYVSIGVAYETGDTFGDDRKGVGVGRIGTELWEGWKLEYEHHSNAVDENDKNSYDAIGIIVEFKFGKQ